MAEANRPAPLQLPATLPPRTTVPVAVPVRVPVTVPVTPSPLLVRAATASGPVRSGLGKFLIELGKQLWSDPKRMKQWWATMAGKPAPRPLPVPEEVEAETGEAADALSTRGALLGMAVVLFALMLIHAGRPRGEEDEEALLDQRLPGFMRVGVRHIVHQLTPRAPPLVLMRGLGDRELKVMASLKHRQDKARKESLKNTEQATTRQDVLEVLRKAAKECKSSENSGDKCCQGMAANIEDFADAMSKMNIRDENLTPQYQMQGKEEATLSALEKEVSDDKSDVSFKTMKQGEDSMASKYPASSPGPDAEPRNDQDLD